MADKATWIAGGAAALSAIALVNATTNKNAMEKQINSLDAKLRRTVEEITDLNAAVDEIRVLNRRIKEQDRELNELRDGYDELRGLLEQVLVSQSTNHLIAADADEEDEVAIPTEGRSRHLRGRIGSSIQTAPARQLVAQPLIRQTTKSGEPLRSVKPAYGQLFTQPSKQPMTLHRQTPSHLGKIDSVKRGLGSVSAAGSIVGKRSALNDEDDDNDDIRDEQRSLTSRHNRQRVREEAADRDRESDNNREASSNEREESEKEYDDEDYIRSRM